MLRANSSGIALLWDPASRPMVAQTFAARPLLPIVLEYHPVPGGGEGTGGRR